MRLSCQCHAQIFLILRRRGAPSRRTHGQFCSNNVGAILYILHCSDGSYYAGTTRDSLGKRVSEHQAGTHGGYTAYRRSVKLVFQQAFDHIEDAIAAERQIKGWRREKKEALIRGDFAALSLLASRAERAEIESSPK